MEMESVLKADIFFFVSTIAVIAVSVAAVVALIYFIKILRDVKHMAQKARQETDEIVREIDLLKERLKKDAGELSRIFAFLKKVFKIKKKVKKK